MRLPDTITILGTYPIIYCFISESAGGDGVFVYYSDSWSGAIEVYAYVGLNSMARHTRIYKTRRVGVDMMSVEVYLRRVAMQKIIIFKILAMSIINVWG